MAKQPWGVVVYTPALPRTADTKVEPRPQSTSPSGGFPRRSRNNGVVWYQRSWKAA